MRRIHMHLTNARASLRSDRGYSLIEILVGLVISAAIVGAIIALIGGTSRLMTSAQASTQTMGQLESASTQLMRDVTDARAIIEATPSSLTLEVVRDSACVLTTWTAAGGELSVSRVTFTQAPGAPGDPACADSGGERAEVRAVQRLTTTAPFAYFSRESTDTSLEDPVQADDVARVTWSLMATPAYPADAESRTVASGAAINQRSGSSGGGQVDDARAPLLEVVTPHEGVGQPVLRWTDPTPAPTQSWTLFRIAYPEGGSASGTWEALITLPAASTGYTDTSLPAGYTARYILRASLTDGRTGPTSNQVATGVRPAPVTLTATGQLDKIALSWTAAPGATAYDLYRDGALYQPSLPGTTWTDSTGRGHSHAYRIVPVNRWERCAVRAARCTEALQTYQVPVGTPDTASLPGGSPTAVRRLSAVNEAAGAYTSPLAPSLSATPNANWSNTLGWTPSSSWTGAGPVTKGGVHRDRGWSVRMAPGTGTDPGTWPSSPNLWGGGENARGTTARNDAYSQGQVAGQYRHYQARTCNPIGCSPWSGTAVALQRPPQPSCTATKTGITTRQVAITTSRPAIPSAYTSNRVNGWYEGTATSFVASTLAHNTRHVFGVHTRNDSPANGGWSDEAQCEATTDLLAIAITGTSSSTRTIWASAAPTNGTSQNMTLEGVQTFGGTSASWDPLRHGTGFVVTARNSDGWNEVAAQVGVSTQTLTVGAPRCAISGGGQAPNGSYTASASGTGVQYDVARTRSGLSAGTYSVRARGTDNDGWNFVTSGWVSCGSVTVSPPPAVYGWSTSAPTICGRVASSGAVRAYVSSQYSATHYASTAYTGGTPVSWWVVVSGGTGEEVHDARWRIAVVNRATDRSDQIEGGYLCSGVYG
ncbi:prepilin-type N-terminal cleavage/methylation domain-containing protein [Cellulomonas iranensis]|uniref:prepilin-type N-terminal cleavage/methylation domain-containing protein n=1 Tax=Cellulomonas iranensis TaxID=76862 RepID=UPI0013D75396|nr:prepilin-type N-terminal cleavage/methylation domain-containing protein [Cellulomonas iranensis]